MLRRGGKTHRTAKASSYWGGGAGCQRKKKGQYAKRVKAKAKNFHLLFKQGKAKDASQVEGVGTKPERNLKNTPETIRERQPARKRRSVAKPGERDGDAFRGVAITYSPLEPISPSEKGVLKQVPV